MNVVNTMSAYIMHVYLFLVEQNILEFSMPDAMSLLIDGHYFKMPMRCLLILQSEYCS